MQGDDWADVSNSIPESGVVLGQSVAMPHQRDLFIYEDKIGSELFSEILDRSELGIIVVDRNATILSCNRAAQALLVRGEGLILKGQSFSTAHASDKALLSRAIKRAVSVNGDDSSAMLDHSALLISRSEHLPLTVEVLPAKAVLDCPDRHSFDLDEVPAAVILVVDPETSLAESVRRVCFLYGLTPAETRLAELLIDGLTLAEISDEMKVKVSTVRVYLRQIFSKMGVNRQPMLIRMLLTARIPIIFAA